MLRVKGQAATEGFAIEHFAGSVTYTTSSGSTRTRIR